MNTYATKLDSGIDRFAFSIGEKKPEDRRYDLICNASRSALDELCIQLCNSIANFDLNDETLTAEEKNRIVKTAKNAPRDLLYASDISIVDFVVPQDLKAYRDDNFGRLIVEMDGEEKIAMYRAVTEEINNRETVWGDIISSL